MHKAYMLSSFTFLLVILGLLLIMQSSSQRGYSQSPSSANNTDEQQIVDVKVDEASRCIIPGRTDFAEAIPGAEFRRNWLYPKTVAKPTLIYKMNTPVTEALGSGEFWGPYNLKQWHLKIRYTVYASPTDAVKHWQSEYSTECTFHENAYSGKKIGDNCAILTTRPDDRQYLHIIRNCASVQIAGFPTIHSTEAARNEMKNAMEIWAEAMVRRVDRVAQKGAIGIANLPPIVDAKDGLTLEQ